MQDLNDKVTGGTLSADEWNEVPSEMQNIIENTGQTLSGADLNQMGKGVAQYVANGNFYTDSGAADAYVLTSIGLKQITPAYVDGMAVEFIPGNTNTGSSTVNVGGLGVKSIAGTAIGGELAAGIRVELRYRLGTDDFEIISADAAATPSIFTEDLTKLIHPDQSKGLQELQTQGAYPVSFNQQWGGMGYGGLPDGTLGEIATGIIHGDGGEATLANAVSTTYRAQGFKVGQTTDLNSVWVKIYKTGNPTSNLQLFIYSDVGGVPNALIANGTATSQSGKQHTDNTDGEWVKFTFATAPNVIAGTQYHVVLRSSGAVDASNYWNWMDNQTNVSYPHGTLSAGDATPTWTPDPARISLFLVEPVTNILQSGLTNFDGALHCYEGADLDQSGAFYADNRFMNHKRGLIHFAGTGFTKDKTLYDSGLATDNNRIVLRCLVTSGFAQIDLYEADGTKHTVTGTTDISTGDHIVSIGYRAEADGSDFLVLYVDGASEGTPISAATLSFDRAFEDGHSTIGGGFPIAPTWTQDLDMAALPSAVGWTFVGTATEANAFVVDGGILYQNGAGYASGDTGSYQKTTTLNNGAGWAVETKLKINESSNTDNDGGCILQIKDGTKRVDLYFHEYFMYLFDGVTFRYVQLDLSKRTTILVIGKGSDVYVYADGKLIFDGTGYLTQATALNNINFGDAAAAANETATVEWSYFKYFEGEHLPEYSSMQMSEFAYWADDKSALLDNIYNGGDIQPVKALAGSNENYIEAILQKIEAKGVTASPSTTSVSPLVPADEMQIFAFGKRLNVEFSASVRNSAVAGTQLNLSVDGAELTTSRRSTFSAIANAQTSATPRILSHVHSGLHFVSGLYATDSSTSFLQSTYRNLLVEAE